MTGLRGTTASRKADRVPVPSCACGEPTAMRVPSALLDEIQIWHLRVPCLGSADGSRRVPCFRSADGAPRVPGISDHGERPRLRAVRRRSS